MQDHLALSSDRLAFALFLAIVVHLILLTAITFSPERPGGTSRVLDITLATAPSEQAPRAFDFVADQNQRGEDKQPAEAYPTTTTGGPTNQEPDLTSAESTASAGALSPRDTPRQWVSDLTQFRRPSNDFSAPTTQRFERVQRLTQVNAAASPEANYLRSWQRKIETIGNLNYPRAARQLGIYGELRLLVVIDASGGLKDVRVLASSGEPVLDQAAENIVRLAEPFPPFSKALLAKTDVLEIVRTWQFRKNSRSLNVSQ
jgi:protein TonB